MVGNPHQGQMKQCNIVKNLVGNPYKGQMKRVKYLSPLKDKLYRGIHLLSSLGNLHMVSKYVYYIRPNITFLSKTQNRNSGKTGEKIVLLHGI